MITGTFLKPKAAEGPILIKLARAVRIDTSDKIDLIRFDTVSIERATRYNPSESQCDKTPYLTADQSFIDTALLKSREIRWCALSWDLMYDEYRQEVAYRDWAWNGQIRFGDTIMVTSESSPIVNGEWVVHDVMNSRYRKSMDFLYHKDNMSPKLGVCKDVKILIKR